jgi:hypothetical protein
VRLARLDARDHVYHRKNVRWRSCRFYGASQGLNSRTCDICEIFEAPRFFQFFNTIRRERPLRERSFRRIFDKQQALVCGLQARSLHSETSANR